LTIVTSAIENNVDEVGPLLEVEGGGFATRCCSARQQTRRRATTSRWACAGARS
jgi:hypothetical protein